MIKTINEDHSYIPTVDTNTIINNLFN